MQLDFFSDKVIKYADLLKEVCEEQDYAFKVLWKMHVDQWARKRGYERFVVLYGNMKILYQPSSKFRSEIPIGTKNLYYERIMIKNS